MKKIAIANQKGGTGKTTATANLGHALAEMGIPLAHVLPGANAFCKKKRDVVL